MVSLEPHQKDGGVFVQFTYSAGDPASALKSLQKALREEAGKHGGMPSWIGMAKGDAWLVKGTPWREVMIISVLNDFLSSSSDTGMLGYAQIRKSYRQTRIRRPRYPRRVCLRYSPRKLLPFILTL